MTDVPRWPGVAEYLYHAASSAAEVSGGTWIVPSWLRPRLSRLELTPIAGMSTDTGSERSSDGPGPPPVVPADTGCGACTWAAIATPIATTPVRMNAAAANPASRARNGRRGGGATPDGADMTTRKPYMRRHSGSANATPRVFRILSCSRSLIFQ